jgi:Ca-activated chloride channel family protein
MKIELSFEYPQYAASQIYHTLGLFSIVAPKLTGKKRPKVNILAVVDVSGSMTGDKLLYTKKSLAKLMQHLQDGDNLGILTFANTVQTLVPMAPVGQTGRERIESAIRNMNAQGGTNLFSAVQEATRAAANHDGASRIILFTDGDPTVGLIDKNAIAQATSGLMDHITVSAFGYGTDHDPVFLSKIAENGRGNFAFIQEADGALTAFANELGGLLSSVATDIKIHLAPAKGFRITKVRNDLDVELGKHNEGLIVRIPDIYSEEEKHVLFDCHIDPHNYVPRAVTMFDYLVEYTDVLTGESRTIRGKAKLRFTKTHTAETPNQKIRDLKAVFDLYDAQRQAEAFAKVGNFTMASTVFNSVQLGGASSQVSAYANSLAGNYANEAIYSSNIAGLQATLSSAKNMRSAVGSSASYFVSNSTQTGLADSFQSPPTSLMAGSGPNPISGDLALDLSNLQKFMENIDMKKEASK